MKSEFSYYDFLHLNTSRQCRRDGKANTIEIREVNFELGQVKTNWYNFWHNLWELRTDSIENFLYSFIKRDIVIENPEAFESYNFNNLKSILSPKEFESELRTFAKNAILIGNGVSFNSFILKPLREGWEVTGYLDSSVDTLIFPAFVTSIGDEAFKTFPNLIKVELPSKLKQIGRCAFYGCPGLMSIDIPEGVPVIEDSAFKYSGINTVRLPTTLRIIRREAFAYTTLKHLIMPSVEEIEEKAFYDCMLRGTLRLPENLRHSYTSAFGMQFGLNSIYTPKSSVIEYDTVFTAKIKYY